ncbi:MAG: energy-coupling factor transporter ATPase [Candidatus Bathyarchaeia archaeon]
MSEILRVEDLWWRYEGRKDWVLRGLDLSVSSGEVVGIVGPSGAGKTTFCLSLVGVIPQRLQGAYRGKVTVDGLDTVRDDLTEISRRLSLVFEDPETQYVMSTVEDEILLALENIVNSREEISERIEWALKAVGLSADFLQRNPLQLSGGEKQRVAIASAIATHPKILVLDEPTSDIDPVGKLEVFESIRSLREELGATVLIVEHETEFLSETADRIVAFSNGRVAFEGAPQRVFSDISSIQQLGISPPHPCRITCALGLKPSLTELEAERTLKEAITKGYVKVREVIEEPPREPRCGMKELASLDRVYFSYPNGAEALKGVDLKIYEGDFIALVGPNGSGKSTLAKILCGLLPPTAGQVKIEGKPISRFHRRDLAKLVSYVFQNPDHQLFNQTVRDEVAFAPRILDLPEDEVTERTSESISAMELNGLEDEHPLFLSKGERRRLALASILSLKPKMLIIDEPTTGQDYRTNSRIMALLRNLNRSGYTILLITHALSIVSMVVDRLLVMHMGRILKDGTPKEVLDDDEVVKKARLIVPTAKRIAERLSSYGVSKDVLTVEELLKQLAP